MNAVNGNYINYNNLAYNIEYSSQEVSNDDETIYSSVSYEDSEESTETLQDKFESVQDEQGIIGKLWNGFKNLTGLGLSSNDVEDSIEQYENGEITYEEALETIESYETKQDGIVDTAANVISGAVVAGAAIATGGVSLAAGAAIGGAVKAGIKTVDRATNEIEGDELDAKEIAKDFVTGAVDGAVTIATAGIGQGSAVNSVKEAVVDGVISGVKSGAISGAASGAASYTMEAATEEDVDFTVDGFVSATVQNAAAGAVMGGVMGGITGGISYAKGSATAGIISDKNNWQGDVQDIDTFVDAETGIRYTWDEAINGYVETVDDIVEEAAGTPALAAADDVVENTAETAKVEELKTNAEQIYSNTKNHIDEAKSQIKETFGSSESVKDGGEITARPKSEDSIISKLERKLNKNKLQSTDFSSCESAIGDAYGTRVQMKSLSTEEAQDIINDCLYGYDNISYNDYVNYLHEDYANLTSAQKETLDEINGTITDLLKEAQSQDVVDKLVSAIKDPDCPYSITELNNYGDELTSYFTDNQIQQIADAYAEVNPDQKLNIVTKIDTNSEKLTITANYDADGNLLSYSDSTGAVYTKNADGNFIASNGSVYNEDGIITEMTTDSAVYTNNGAKKDSGYTSSQMNVVHEFNDNTTGLGELQIRGTEVNAFADAEHIPYDIRTGKITAENTKYSDVFEIFHTLSDDSYNQYNKYLSDTYKALRLNELGIETELPTMDGMTFTASAEYGGGDMTAAVQSIDRENLIKISKRH